MKTLPDRCALADERYRNLIESQERTIEDLQKQVNQLSQTLLGIRESCTCKPELHSSWERSPAFDPLEEMDDLPSALSDNDDPDIGGSNRA